MIKENRVHQIIQRPHEYEVIYIAYSIDREDYRNSSIELHLSKGNTIKKLKFYQPVDVAIDRGFNGSYSGMEIIDIRDRQLDSIGVWVRNSEQDPGITFMAREVIEVKD